MVDSDDASRTGIIVLTSRSRRPIFRGHDVLMKAEINDAALQEPGHETCCSFFAEYPCWHRRVTLSTVSAMEKAAPIGNTPTPWCPCEVRARSRHVRVDSGFILDDTRPIPCRSRQAYGSLSMIKNTRIHRIISHHARTSMEPPPTPHLPPYSAGTSPRLTKDLRRQSRPPWSSPLRHPPTLVPHPHGHAEADGQPLQRFQELTLVRQVHLDSRGSHDAPNEGFGVASEATDDGTVSWIDRVAPVPHPWAAGISPQGRTESLLLGMTRQTLRVLRK